MDRRRFLTSTAGLLVLTSGCTQSGDSTATVPTSATAPPTETQTATATPGSPDPVSLEPGEPFTTDAGFSVTVENVAVHLAVVEFGTVHHDPLYRDGEQFLVADVAVSGEGAPDPTETNVFLETATLADRSRRYVAADSNEDGVRQRFGFPVPVSPTPASGAVVWTRDAGPNIRWTLSPSTLSAIGQPPEFDVQEFDARDVPGDEVEISLTVSNTGERDGRFLAEAGDAGLSDQPEIGVTVPAGETVSATRRVWASFGDREELTVVLRWAGQKRTRTVRQS